MPQQKQHSLACFPWQNDFPMATSCERLALSKEDEAGVWQVEGQDSTVSGTKGARILRRICGTERERGSLIPLGQSQEKVSQRCPDLQQGREWANLASECSSWMAGRPSCCRNLPAPVLENVPPPQSVPVGSAGLKSRCNIR